MSEQKKTAAAAKPPKKLIPRPAPKAEAKVEEQAVVQAAPASPAPEPAPAPAVKPVAKVAEPKAAAPKARAPRKPSRVDETVARHQKVLADALTKAQAIKYEQPAVVKTGKPEKPAKAKKVKLVRDSYAMPEAEYAQIGVLKKRLVGLGKEAKKSELLRAGVTLLAALNDAELVAVMGRVERIKTGRPAK